MKKQQENKSIVLPGELYDRIQERAKTTGFGSVIEYVVFVLEEVLKDEGEHEGISWTREEEGQVKKRLKALGYLD